MKRKPCMFFPVFYPTYYYVPMKEYYYDFLGSYLKRANALMRQQFPEIDKFKVLHQSCTSESCNGDIIYGGDRVASFSFTPPKTQDVEFNLPSKYKIGGIFKASITKKHNQNCVNACIYQRNDSEWVPIALGGKHCISSQC